MASADARQKPPLVLIVDDEPLIRMIVIETLEDAGFNVLAARDAHEALRLFERQDEVALVLTDIDMPGSLNGLELRAELLSRAPHVPVLVISGGGGGSDRSPGARFLAKPFNSRDLVAAVVSCLKPDDDPA